MKEKAVNYTLIIMAIVIILGFAFFKLSQVNEQTREQLPNLIPGEHIEYFSLTGEDASQVNASVFRGDRPALIFIFSRPCNPCQKNFQYWRKMKEILGDRVDFYGIILGNAASAFEFSKKANLNFKIYVPEDVDRFIQAMRIKLNLAQTILYSRDSVKFLKLGDLEGNESVNIINLAKELI